MVHWSWGKELTRLATRCKRPSFFTSLFCRACGGTVGGGLSCGLISRKWLYMHGKSAAMVWKLFSKKEPRTEGRVFPILGVYCASPPLGLRQHPVVTQSDGAIATSVDLRIRSAFDSWRKPEWYCDLCTFQSHAVEGEDDHDGHHTRAISLSLWSGDVESVIKLRSAFYWTHQRKRVYPIKTSMHLHSVYS